MPAAAQQNLLSNPAFRIAKCDWRGAHAALDEQGFATFTNILSADECAAIAALYDKEEIFRSRIIMARHGFGSGAYKYFAYPLPRLIGALRAALYPCLAPIADAWAERLGAAARFPADHETFLDQCRAAGQTRPTPLLLKYEAGDYNCLHQDLYGAIHFPLQAAILLSAPNEDFTGGEFVLTEQRPRMQSRAIVAPLNQGDMIVFAVNHRPVRGARGDYRVAMRHGVSQIRTGRRLTLGLILHDAA